MTPAAFGRRQLLRAAAASTAIPVRAAEPERVDYPRHLPQQDSQVNSFVELMRLALVRCAERERFAGLRDLARLRIRMLSPETPLAREALWFELPG